MPGDLYDLNSAYGTEEDLIGCVRALQAAGLKVLGDAVLNHRCAQHQDEHGVWNKYGGKMAWDARAIVGECWVLVSGAAWVCGRQSASFEVSRFCGRYRCAVRVQHAHAHHNLTMLQLQAMTRPSAAVATDPAARSLQQRPTSITARIL
jgi:hypothetical protein